MHFTIIDLNSSISDLRAVPEKFGKEGEEEEVAVKVVNIRGEEAMDERLAREPQILIKLQDCENVVKLLDHEMLTRELMVVVMELGQHTLADILSGGDLSLAEVREHWDSVLSCVENLHTNNIIHCDIKPENFIILDGKMKIIDFGLSVILPEAEASIDVEKTCGTGVYLAPECADSRLCEREGAKRFVSRIRWKYSSESNLSTAISQPQCGYLVCGSSPACHVTFPDRETSSRDAALLHQLETRLEAGTNPGCPSDPRVVSSEKSRTETEHWAAENDEDLRLVSVIDGYIEYAFCNYVIKALFKYKVLFALFFLFFR